MGLIEKLRESLVFKIIFCIILLLIIFDKVIIYIFQQMHVNGNLVLEMEAVGK